EGVAHARPPRWEVGDDWYVTARPAMDGLRIALWCVAGLSLAVAVVVQSLLRPRSRTPRKTTALTDGSLPV
ncbi:hypothetical protein AB0R12_39350, partial [Streptomyces niveus]|uniref:hypothetical protein n=1 Tax=Streptomyces niveus TaxID=193462 RepID=UPI00344104C9